MDGMQKFTGIHTTNDHTAAVVVVVAVVVVCLFPARMIVYQWMQVTFVREDQDERKSIFALLLLCFRNSSFNLMMDP
jgi:hypothetical protein